MNAAAVAPTGPSIFVPRSDGPWPCRVCWLALAVLHVTACAFSSLFTIVYTQMGMWEFGSSTFMYDLIIAYRYLPAIGIVLAALGVLHLLLLVRMIYASVSLRRLSFKLPTRPTGSRRRVSSLGAAITTLTAMTSTARTRGLLKTLTTFAGRSVGRHGWIGIDGPYFDHFFVGREVVQVVLQTVQLHKMARLLSTTWLLHVYVAIVCINCWSSKLLYILSTWGNKSHTVLDGSHRRRRRMFAMLMDSFLDNLTTFFMPLIISVPYITQYDRILKAFPMSAWTDDLWIMQAAADIQLLLVVSWSDFTMKLVFALLVLVSTHAIHDLCHDQFDAKLVRPSKNPEAVVKAAVAVPSTRMARIRTWIHAVLIVWGIGLAGLHAYATSRPPVTGCLLPVRPWFSRHASCAVLQVDCHLRGSNGSYADTQAALNELSPEATVYLILRHCRALDVPSNIQSFRNLLGIKIYNVTLVDWSTDAALRGDCHVSLRIITMVRVAFPNQGDGLPDGLVHPKFPQTVADIDVCVSNLKYLPSDLDTKWPRGLSLFLEMSRFDSFPDVVTRMDAGTISFSQNRITTVPMDKLLLPDRRLRVLSVGGNPLVDIGHNVTKVSLPPAFFWLIIDMNQQLTTMPPWLLDPSVITRLWLIVGGTPVCDEILASRLAGPSTQPASGFSWQQFVDCLVYPPPLHVLFHLFFEDARSSLDPARIGDPELA